MAPGHGGAPEPGPVLAERGSLLLPDAREGRRPGPAAGCRCRSRPSRAARCGRPPRPTRGCSRDGSRRGPGCRAGRTRRRRRTAAAGRRPGLGVARRRPLPALPGRDSTSARPRRTNTSGRQSGAPTCSSSPTRSTHADWRPTSSSTARRSTGSSAPQWSWPATWASRIRGPSAAISGGTIAGSSRSSIAPSWAKNGGTTLSQAVPSAVGSCQMLDRFQVRPCTAGPVRSRPAAASAASAQARSAAGPPGRAYGSRSGCSASGSWPVQGDSSVEARQAPHLGQVGHRSPGRPGRRLRRQQSQHRHVEAVQPLRLRRRRRRPPATRAGRPRTVAGCRAARRPRRTAAESPAAAAAPSPP